MCVVHYQCRFVGSLISLTAVCLTGGGGDGHRHHFIQTRSTKIFFFDGFTEHLVSDELGLRSFDTGKKKTILTAWDLPYCDPSGAKCTLASGLERA